MAILMFGPDARMSPFYISSSGNSRITNNPLDTRLYFLGTASWSSSISQSFSGSNHDRLFWMYDNAGSFPTNYSNLYYITYQSRSLTSTTFTTGALPSVLASYTSPGFYTNAIPPINAPAYNYQLIVSKSATTFITAGGNIASNRIMAWNNLTQDSLRSGSGNTIFGNTPQGYGGQFNTSSGQYTFIRQNLPTSSTTPIRAIPVDFTISAQFAQDPGIGVTARFEIIGTSSAVGSSVVRYQSSPDTVLSLGTGFQTVTWSGSLNIYSGSANQVWQLADANPASYSPGPPGGIAIVATGSSPSYRSASLQLSQPLTGRQIAAHPPITYSSTPNGDPTINDSGSYIVITPNLRGLDALQPVPLTGNETQLNYTFACYYFKSAYHLWRDAWQVQSADGNPICPQSVWISASSNPSWGQYLLYSSQSSGPAFAGYGTSSIDGRVRNRAYIGITAELLGGSNIVPHLKANFAGTTSASFAGNKFGGMIVVKASNVGKPNLYDLGQTNFVWAQPGDSAQNLGLPSTVVNDSDVVPFSNFLETNNTTTDLIWRSNISWPPSNPYAYNPE